MTRQLIMLCLCCFVIQATKAQGKELLSLSVKNEPLKEILKRIESQCESTFVYNETIDLSIVRTVIFKDKDLTTALKFIFTSTGIEWKISGKHILLKKSAKKITISGFVSDKENKETLIGAYLTDKNSVQGTATNDYGYFSLSVPSGKQILNVSYVGYQSLEIPLSLNKDTILNLELEQQNWLKEIVITPKKRFSPSSGSIEFSMEDIKNTPVPFGETDILKTLQLLPGVQAGIEGTSGLYVRGGGPDQNLTLLDGVNVYNTSHFYGLFSIFNGDAVKKVTLYKGSFPARFGGRLSSVIDTRMKDGDMRNYHGSFSIGLLSSRLNFEGPIIKDRTSFSFSARRSYIDGFLRAAKIFTEETVPIIYFYDVNAKLNHKFSDKSRLYLSFYKGKDKLGSKLESDSYNRYELENYDYQWGNTIGSLRWNYIFNNKLFANATIAYNNYNFDFKNTIAYKHINTDLTTKQKNIDYFQSYTTYQYSGIEDWSGNIDFEFLPNNKHHIRFGGGYIYHTFKPEVHGNKQYEQEKGKIIKDIDHSFLSENIKGNEASLYIEDEIKITDKWSTNVGLHSSMFEVSGKNYWSIQPRLSLGYEMDDNLSFKTSYTKMNQYVHLLTSSALSQPTDLWVPVTPNLSPLSSKQITLGAFYETRKGYNFSIEGFYKIMNNLLEYKNGSSWASASTTWDRQVEAGKGRSYGIELFAQKTTGKLTGWIGYTLAWNDRKFPTINEGKRFSAKYDRRHDIKLNLAYKLNEKLDFSAAWTYASGNNMTLAVEEYPTPLANIIEDIYMRSYYSSYGSYQYSPASQWVEKYENRNNYRMASTHHLDLSINYYRKKSPKGRQASWNLTIYNAYNQACPFMVYPGFSDSKGKFVLKQISLLPILPSLTYTYKF